MNGIQSKMLAVAAGCLLLVGVVIVQAQQVNLAVQDGVEVETRGPIHEAFAQPSTGTPLAGPILAKPAPEPVNELPPEQKPEGDQAQWIPGYWAWDDDRQDYMWVSGMWRVPPPGRRWVPGYMQDVQGGQRWISGYWGVSTATTVDLLPPPPEPILESPTPQPSADTTLTPGIWVYQDNRYLWQPSHWVPIRAGWIWVPAHYFWTPRGYIFVRGYWDYELDQRGMLFAPVYLDARIYRRPGWFYRPHFVIAPEFLLGGALFVNSGSHAYYFGDYYAPTYAGRYTPWVDYAVRGNRYDPLFSYYRWQHRGDARWEANLRSTYVARRENVDQRPPRTLAQQNRVGAKVVVATPINQWKGTQFKLEPVTNAHMETIRKSNQEWRNYSTQRGKIETEIKPTPGVAKQPNIVPPPVPKQPVIGAAPEIKPLPPVGKQPNVVPGADIKPIPPVVKQPNVVPGADIKPSPPVVKQLPVVAPVTAPVRVELPKTTIIHPEIKKVPPPHPEPPKAALPAPTPKKEKASLERSGQIKEGERLSRLWLPACPSPSYDVLPVARLARLYRAEYVSQDLASTPIS